MHAGQRQDEQCQRSHAGRQAPAVAKLGNQAFRDFALDRPVDKDDIERRAGLMAGLKRAFDELDAIGARRRGELGIALHAGDLQPHVSENRG